MFCVDREGPVRNYQLDVMCINVIVLYRTLNLFDEEMLNDQILTII